MQTIIRINWPRHVVIEYLCPLACRFSYIENSSEPTKNNYTLAARCVNVYESPFKHRLFKGCAIASFVTMHGWSAARSLQK